MSREWLLAENRSDGRTMLYAAVEWDDDNPADFLSAGWWLHYPPGVDVDEFEMAERGVFIDGPELDLSIPPEMPISGEPSTLAPLAASTSTSTAADGENCKGKPVRRVLRPHRTEGKFF